MKRKIIFIGLFLCGLTLIFSPRLFESFFPKPKVIEVPYEKMVEVEKIIYVDRPVEKIVEKISYQPVLVNPGEMKLTKQTEDMYILETLPNQDWSMKIEPQPNGQNAIVFKKIKP